MRQREATRNPVLLGYDRFRPNAELQSEKDATDDAIAAIRREHAGMPITRPQFREWMNGNETSFRELMKEVRQGSRKLCSVRKGARSDLPKPVKR